MSFVRLGLVGCGAVVQNNYARALPEVAGVRVTAVHDRDQRAAAAAAAIFGAPIRSFDALCEGVDAVVIATPPSSHFGLVTSFIDRGISVICEKPFVGRREEAEAIVALSEKSGVAVYVGHLRRTFPSVRLARDIVATGSLGRVKAMRLVEGGRFAWDTSSGYVSSDAFGGVLFDTGSHTVDMGLFISGLDQERFAVTVDEVRRDRPEPAHDLMAQLRLEASDCEVAVTLSLSRRRALANIVRIELEGGVIEVSAGPRDRIRVSGPGGVAIVPTGPLPADFNGYFTEQFARILVDGTGQEFLAARFVGLSSVLEAVVRATEAR